MVKHSGQIRGETKPWLSETIENRISFCLTINEPPKTKMDKLAIYTGQISSETGPWLCVTIKTLHIFLSHDHGTSNFPKDELNELFKYSGQIRSKTGPWLCETIKHRISLCLKIKELPNNELNQLVIYLITKGASIRERSPVKLGLGIADRSPVKLDPDNKTIFHD